MTIARIASESLAGIVDLIYPPKCLVCGRVGEEPLCSACWAGFESVLPPICDRCGTAIAPGRDPLCPECAKGVANDFGRARAAGLFQGSLRAAIISLKYDGKRRMAIPLGRFLADFLQTNPFAPDHIDLLIPVALHPSRRRERGFNQSALLARAVGRQIGVPVVEDVLQRVRRTRPQVELHESERAANVRDAFAAKRDPRIAGKTLLLVDDVVTSRHTANECARVLVDTGARIVHVVGVARG